VVQLSSKYVGITDPRQVAANGTHRFLAGDILAEHEALRERFGTSAQVVLLLSTDFGSRYRDRGRALWVTLATRPFGSIAQAARWCQGRFPGLSGKDLANVCLPRTLPPPA
jgi:hypothetical protein